MWERGGAFLRGRAASANGDRMTKRWMVGALAIVAGCASKSVLDKEQTKTPLTAGTAAKAGTPSVDAPPTRTAVTPKKLSPIIHELGPDRVVPNAVVVELATPIID